MKKAIIIIATLAGLGFIFWKEILFLILVQFASPKDNVGPHQEIMWQQGPDQRTDNRPNIIVIVADDLGINDMTDYDDLDPSGTHRYPKYRFYRQHGLSLIHI